MKIEGKQRLTAVFKNLSLIAQTPYPIKLKFKDWPKKGDGLRCGHNWKIFASLPGAPCNKNAHDAYVIVQPDILELAWEPDEMAFVLSHEICHIRHEHGLAEQQYADDLFERWLTANPIGQARWDEIAKLEAEGYDISREDKALEEIFMTTHQKEFDQFNKAQEQEADSCGRALALQAGYNPEASARVFSRWHDFDSLVIGKLELERPSHGTHLERRTESLQEALTGD